MVDGLNVPFLTIINFVRCLRVCVAVFRGTANHEYYHYHRAVDDWALDDRAVDDSQLRTSTERQQRRRCQWYDQ